MRYKTIVVCSQISYQFAMKNQIGEIIRDNDIYTEGREYILVHGIRVHVNYGPFGNFAKMTDYNKVFKRLINRKTVNKLIWLSNRDSSFVEAALEYRRFIGKIPIEEYIAFAELLPGLSGVKMRNMEPIDDYLLRKGLSYENDTVIS